MSKEAVEFQKGGAIDVTLSTAVAVGGIIAFSGMIGVAATAGETGEVIAVYIEKVWTVNAKTADVIVVGDVLYWDSTNKELTKTSTSNTKAGRAMSVKGAVAGTVNIKLNV